MIIDIEKCMDNGAQEDPLSMIDTSLGFLLLIIAAVLLSFYSLTIQRRQTVLSLEGKTEELACLPKVFPIRLVGGGIVVGALGYFLQLTQKTAEQAACGNDEVAKRSGSMNLWAAILVLAAAMIRFYDLHYVECNQPRILARETDPV